MNKRLILITGILFPLLVGLLLFFQDFIRDDIVLPVLYLFWLGRFLWVGIDQKYLWGVLIMMAAAILLSTLKTVRKPDEEHVSTGRTQPSQGRVGFWVTKIQQSHSRSYSTHALMQELGNLVVSVLSEQEKSSPNQIQDRVEMGDLSLPPAVKSCVLSRNRDYAPEPYSQRTKWIAYGLRLFRPGKNHANAASEQTLESVVDTLETRLEIKHD